MAKNNNYKAFSDLPLGWVDFDIRNTVKADWNYKTDDEKIQKKLIFNLLEDGNIVNVLLRVNEEDFVEVLDGNHRRDAIIYILKCIEYGEKDGPKTKPIELNQIFDVSMKDESFMALVYNKYMLYKEALGDSYQFSTVKAYNFGKISKSQAQKISLKVNETRFGTDENILNNIISNLVVDFTDEVFFTLPMEAADFDFLNEPLKFGTPPPNVEEKYESDGYKVLKFSVTPKTYSLYESIQRVLQTKELDDNGILNLVFSKFLDIKSDE